MSSMIDLISSFERKDPIKGTETPGLIYYSAGIGRFERKDPIKGTETLNSLGRLELGQFVFERKDPIKGTETLPAEGVPSFLTRI